jgi:hypothetical protein
LQGNGDKGIEEVCGLGEEKYFVLGRLEQPRQNKNLLYWHDKPNERDPSPLFSLSPHSPQFQQSAGPPLSIVSFGGVLLVIPLSLAHNLQVPADQKEARKL